MEELKSLKLEVVAMLDKKKILYEITKNKNFNINVSEPYNEISIQFIKDFSNQLRKQEILKYPDLIYLTFWCANKKIFENKNFLSENQIKVGRGLIFHICPSNVPTNFIYSFFFGLLSGNSNIVKIPSKVFPEKDIIINTINKIFKKKKYSTLKNSNFFLNYDKKIEKTKKISSICDARVIWGGDNTINEIRKIWIPERAIELTFSDRYSFSVINLNKFTKNKFDEIKVLAKKFFYDSYMMNQAACNSPHFIFWIGKNTTTKNLFWEELNNVVKKKFILDEKIAIDKYTHLIKSMIDQKNFDNFKMFQNNIYIIDSNKYLNNIEDIRGKNGIFYQKNINNIQELKKYISKKCQTVTYFGLEKDDIKSFILNNNLFGVDRIVPIGKGLEIGPIWDGYDIIKSLSRIISIE